ncbi:hypothetical protein CXB51_003112 [Gossypium anomalum]|uniref:Integrase catalytic domain-containing protein n=1 Tax=Gossypium anomalum TaxID=47600 RepID=A0A8J5ZGP6_9ROSI|nr:hypothetical protein CXB51_003112 [Gossypium anomalum]
MQAHCHQFQNVSNTSCGSPSCYFQQPSVHHSGLQANTTSSNSQFPTSSLNTKVWYPDSGTSNHVTSDLENLHEATPYTGNNKLFMGNGMSVPVAHIGSSSFTSSNKIFHLKRVLCNAVSSSSANVHTTSLAPPSSNVSVFDLWHKRLGHPCNKTSEALDKFLYLPKLVDVQFGCKIKALQTDWGGEFHAFPKVLSQLGIHHRLFCPHTSEQNGLVERKHRHVVDTGLTLLAQASMPMHFWAHAFISATYLINRLPTSVLAGKSPFEVLHKTVPSYKHLRVPVHKGYKCLDDDKRVFISRHVVFDEDCFPFANSAHSTGASLHSQSILQHHRSSVPIVVPIKDYSRGASPNVTMSSIQQVPRSVLGPVPSHPAHIPLESTSVANPPVSSPVNAHPMTTRFKNGIFKARVFSAELSETEPTTIDEAFASKEWALAAQQEYEALLRNDTWDLVPLLANRRAVGCKCVFKLKKHSDGTIARYKGRIVVKGYLQEASVDFQDTFSPVVKPTTIRVVLALAVQFGWQLRQNHSDKPLVCKLKKALYGLKQAPRAWFSKLRDCLLSSQFSLAKSDGSLFVKKTTTIIIYVLVYVDDIIITGNHQASIDQFVTSLDTQFSLKDLGPLSYFLGIEVSSTSTGLFLSQRKYMLDLLRKAKMDQANSSPTPMVTSSILSQQYVVITKPDITFVVNKFTPTATLDIVGYSDANWGTDVDDQRSTLGFCVFLGGNPVAWGSKKQQVVSRSTSEAEYRGLAHAVTEVELGLYFVREKVAAGKLSVGHVPTQEQVTDVFTKPLTVPLFTKFRSCLKVAAKVYSTERIAQPFEASQWWEDLMNPVEHQDDRRFAQSFGASR